jgi:hypothetical protein
MREKSGMSDQWENGWNWRVTGAVGNVWGMKGGSSWGQNPAKDTSYVPSGSRWQVSMNCLCRSHPPCSCCLEGAQSKLPPWWYGGEDTNIHELDTMSKVDPVPHHGWLVQLKVDISIVLVHPGTNWTACLPNITWPLSQRMLYTPGVFNPR